MDSSNRYYHYKEIDNLVGYVVNIHDAVNYDIDLFLSDELKTRYSNVITNTYTYQDDSGFNVGVAYRCRLKGIGLHQTKKRPDDFSFRRKRHNANENRIIRLAQIDMTKQIDRQNGWVLCNISDVDVYKRLLVTLMDPITKDDLSLILLKSEYRSCFRPYGIPYIKLKEDNSNIENGTTMPPTP